MLKTAVFELFQQFYNATEKIGILPGPTKKWRIKRIDELNEDELDKFYCIILCPIYNVPWNLLANLFRDICILSTNNKQKVCKHN